MTPNIALTGKFRSGKDSVATRLVANHGYTRFAFGDELKRYANELFSYPDTFNGEGDPPKPRELYQWFGQTMRQRDPEIWTRLMFECIDYVSTRRVLAPDGSFATRDINVVISDLRQPNEYAALRQRGYKIVRVTCPDHIRIQRCVAAGDSFDQSTLAHDTESHVDGFDVDWEIVNDGTLDDLRKSVDAIMAQISEVLS